VGGTRLSDFFITFLAIEKRRPPDIPKLTGQNSKK
jgi:hypothetical protein